MRGLSTERNKDVMPRLVVFLDDGGVMSDNSRRSAQWQRLIGPFLAPKLGGTEISWAEANRVVATTFFEPSAWQARLAAASDYLSFERAYLLDWLGTMCKVVGIPCPAEERSIALAREAEAWITSRVDAAFPGVVETIRLLYTRGYTLHTASGESSAQLAGYLTGMGIRDCFSRLYGPDLIDTFKASPSYFERLLADAAVDPADAIVVDDNLHVLAWATAVGACPVQVGSPTSSAAAGPHCITSLSELPALLTRLEIKGAA